MLKSFKLIKSKFSEETISLLKDIAFILLFSLLTGLSAELKVEIGVIPVTAQTLVVLLSGILLGKRKGALSQITYLTAGIAGLPWFSRGGGLPYILSPTFGYLLGFIPASYAAGLLIEKSDSILDIGLSLIFSHFIIYIFGILWLLRSLSFQKALTVGLYPFLAGDSIKVFIATIISKLKTNN